MRSFPTAHAPHLPPRRSVRQVMGYETRQARLERDAAERAAREAARRQAVASGDAVAEAIARARAMKRERGTGNGEREEQ